MLSRIIKIASAHASQLTTAPNRHNPQTEHALKTQANSKQMNQTHTMTTHGGDPDQPELPPSSSDSSTRRRAKILLPAYRNSRGPESEFSLAQLGSLIYKESAVSHHHHRIAHTHAAELLHDGAKQGSYQPYRLRNSNNRAQGRGLELARLTKNRHGFSLIELTVSLGLGGFLLFGAYNYLNNITGTYEHIQKQSEDVVMNSQRLFSRQFLNIMNQSSLSLSFMTLFVPFSNTCTTEAGATKDGPCFFKLSEANELQQTSASISPDDILNNKLKITNPTQVGLNLFNDVILAKYKDAYDERKVVNFKISLPRPARFKRKVIRAEESRYFVGWSLKSAKPSKREPFFVMSVGREANRIFSANLLGGHQDASSEHYYLFNEDPIATQDEKARFAGIVSKYSQRFYLAFLSSYPQLHYVTRMKQIISCSKSKHAFDNSADIDPSKCSEIHIHANDDDSSKNYQKPYSQNFKFIEDREACDTSGKCLDPFFEKFAKINSALSKSNQTYSFTNRHHTNLFHFGFPNVAISASAMQMWPNANRRLISFFKFVNVFGSNDSVELDINRTSSKDSTNIEIQFMDRFIFLPIEFYKFYLEKGPTNKAGKPTKQLVVEADQPWSRRDQPDGDDNKDNTTATNAPKLKQVLIKGLDEDDQIIFGRRLGSFQFSAFLFKHSQTDPPPANNEGNDS